MSDYKSLNIEDQLEYVTTFIAHCNSIKEKVKQACSKPTSNLNHTHMFNHIQITKTNETDQTVEKVLRTELTENKLKKDILNFSVN